MKKNEARPGQILTRSQSKEKDNPGKKTKASPLKKPQPPKKKTLADSKKPPTKTKKAGLNMLPADAAKKLKSCLRKRALPTQRTLFKSKKAKIDPKAPKSPSAVLDRSRRKKIISLCATIVKKHTTVFATQEGWPFFGGYYITINEYDKNKGGNQKQLIDGKVKSSKKKRTNLQVNVLAPTDEAMDMFRSVFDLDDVEDNHDLFTTTNPKMFGKRHNSGNDGDGNDGDDEREEEEENEDD